MLLLCKVCSRLKPSVAKFYKYQWQIIKKLCNTCREADDKEQLKRLSPVIELEEEEYRTCLIGRPNCEGSFLTVKAVRTCPTCMSTEHYRNGTRLEGM